MHQLNLEDVAPENLDCFYHPSDFVGAIRVIEADGGVAGRQPLHGIGDRCDRLDDRLATKAMAATLTRKQVINPMPSESISRLVASDRAETIEYDSAMIAFRILRMLPSISVKLSSV